MPPVLQLHRKVDGVQRHDHWLAAIALAYDFYTVGRVPAGREIDGESLADTSPARFFTPPLNPAAGPWQLIAIVQAAAGANDSVGEVRAWAFKDVSSGPGVYRRIR